MAQSQGNLAQRQPSQRSLIPQSLMNFPMLSRMPSLWGDMDEEWNWMTQLQQNISLYEDDKHIIAEAALPGLSINEIDVSIDQGILRIQGERKRKILPIKRSIAQRRVHIPTASHCHNKSMIKLNLRRLIKTGF